MQRYVLFSHLLLLDIYLHQKINIYENKKHCLFYDTNSFALWM